ncbi:hypothetical protein GS429_16770 [Natronorubrum sp. JWXQ-INN-674]|uniref:Uncharacterized protein n=1 Tax=Natronorubrum halalkaliphilum TaxID=2691917 RepID=A0A6B0VSC8_9EURY|nr:hypothetical protein [Natronorubrum halalkaliphilum]MXV63682.1 hypothetical protein [Natronorubrum halalkaliphilum]
MDDTVDVQGTAIGIGTVVALVFFAYNRYINETLLGIDAATLATGAFAATFAAVALLHGGYGRQDLAVANAIAAAGLLFVTLAATGPQMLGGLALLVVGGSYVTLATVRARGEQREVAG